MYFYMKSDLMDELKTNLRKSINAIFESAEEEKVAICITLPKTIKWSDYQRELDVVKFGEQEMNYRLSNKPSKVSVGDRCYICHDGFLKGWMTITDISYKDAFECSTTGEQWEPGWYISRSGDFHYIKEQIPMKGFMGYKYIKPVD